MVVLIGCAPAGGSTPETPPSSGSPAPVASSTAASPSPSVSTTRTAVEPTRSETRTPTPTPTPSLPLSFPIAAPLLDGGAASAVRQLHKVSGFRPALKLDVSRDDVTLTVLASDQEVRSYRWRDDVIESAETDVQYLQQTIFWPTDFALDNVSRIFDVAALLGTSSNSQVLQVVEYTPGRVYMSVTTSPESSTIFFRKDATVFRSLDTTSVADIREGVAEVTSTARLAYSVGFDAQKGYFAELPTRDGDIERRVRMANRPMFSSRHTGTSPLEPFSPGLLDPAAIARTIASHNNGGKGCAVQIDNRFNRTRPVVTYQCDGKTFHSDLRGTDLTEQLR